MSGIQLFLKRDIPVAHGHCILIDAPWALTLFSQPQFWSECDVSQRGDGSVRGIFSIDISDWNAPGIVHGSSQPVNAPSRRFSRRSGRSWASTCATRLKIELSQSVLADWFLDPGITFPSAGRVESAEPLLVNTIGSWWDRPEAVSAVPNLYLASDYVRSATDLATMEGANEAARRAVNGVLVAAGVGDPPCRLWALQEPEIFGPAKALDALRFKLGLPHRTL